MKSLWDDPVEVPTNPSARRNETILLCGAVVLGIAIGALLVIFAR